MAAPRYDVAAFLGQPTGSTYASYEPHALVAVYPLGNPISFDRKKKASVSADPADAVKLRAPPIYYHDHVVELSVERSKAQHVKQASVVIQDASSLRDVLPGDWCAVWLVPDRERFEDLLGRVRDGQPANKAADGLRLIGRVHQVDRSFQTAPNGVKNVQYVLQMIGFDAFDAQLYYDLAVATNDVTFQQAVGRWLTRVGVDADAWFAKLKTENGVDNINSIIPAILDIVLGQGASKSLNPAAAQGISGAAGAGVDENAPNAYLVPVEVGRLLGVTPRGKALAYAELIDPLIGVQEYATQPNVLESFAPSGLSPLFGSYLPQFPQLVNTPFWSVLETYLNPAVNEMYTALRVSNQTVGEPTVLPTLVVRQIPFTTDAFQSDRVPHVTRFRDLPRWVIPPHLIVASRVGRSDATRTNLVHVYGSASLLAGNMSVTRQIAQNPPIRDDLDVQRSGPRPLMQVVEAGASADDVKTGQAGRWMDLIADRQMGMQLTLRGTIRCTGIPGPIAEGDNVEVDGLVLHLEAIADEYHVEDHARTWRTTLTVTNGVLADPGADSLGYYGIGDNPETSPVDAVAPAESERLRHG